LFAGIILLAAFVPLRAFNAFGNIRPMAGSTWIDFLNVVKYPPSWSFTFITMGLNLLLLSGLNSDKIRNGWVTNTLAVFGRVPLFIYLTHLLLFAVLGRIFTPSGSSYLLMYIFWIAGITLLYYPAQWYARQKSSPQARRVLQYL
jgi:hypothetical protein